MRQLPRLALVVSLATAAACTIRPAATPTRLDQRRAADTALARARALAASATATGEELALSGWLVWMHGADEELALNRFRSALSVDATTPLAHLGLAELARQGLDDIAAATAYLTLLEGAPGDPLAEVALARLPDVLGGDEGIDAAAVRVLRGLVEADAATAAVRHEARNLLGHRLEARGDVEGARQVWRAGSPSAYTVVGPFSRTSTLEKDRPFLSPSGDLPAHLEGPFGEIVPWIVDGSDGSLSFVGAPDEGDVYYALVDVTFPEDAELLLAWTSASDLHAKLAGETILVRDAVGALAPQRGKVQLRVAAGRHRLVVRLLRGVGGGHLELAFLDPDGHPAAVSFEPARGPASTMPIARARRRPRPEVIVLEAPTPLSEVLASRYRADPTGALPAFLSALHALAEFHDAAKAFAAEAVEAAPGFAGAHHLAARVAYADPALPGDLRAGRANASALSAIALDPGHGAARLLAARIAIDQDRYDEATALLDETAAPSPHAPHLARIRSQLLLARGQPVLAREVLEAAHLARPGDCDLLRRVHQARRADSDVAGTDASAEALRRCGPWGELAYAEHRAERGDRKAAIAVMRPWIALHPTQLRQVFWFSELLLAEGDGQGAREILEAARARFPHAASGLARLADVAAELGDDASAADLRQAALALDPGALHLRRALAFAEGEALLDWGAVDLDAAIAAHRRAPERWGTDTVLVVDHAAVEVFADDPARPVVVERIQMVTQILTKEGLDRQGEVSVPRGAEIVALHSVKPDGRIFDPEITPHKDTITLSNLEIGDYVVLDYLLASGPRTPALPGWAASPFYVRVYGTPLHAVSYVARAPRSVGLEVEARGVEVTLPTEDGEYLVFRYEASEVPPVHPEPDSTSADELLPWIRVGAGAGPEAYGDAWGDFVSDRARPDHEVRTFTEAVLAELPRSVRRDRRARAVALATAVDGHVAGRAPSTQLTDQASHVLVRGRGNRLLATRAVLGAAGIESRIALIQPFDADPAERRFPVGDRYRHAVLVVDPGDGDPPLWIDQNVRTAPIGTLRPVHAAAPALLLAEPGRPTEVVTTPPVDREQEARRTDIHLRLDPSGGLVAEGVDTYTGFWAAMVRSGMEQVPDERRRQVVEASLAQTFGPLRLTNLSFEGEMGEAGPGDPMIVRYRFVAAGWARVRDGELVVPGGKLFPSMLSRRLVRLSERQLPLMLTDEAIHVLRATFEVPEGYGPAGEVPGIALESPVGTFSRQLVTDDGPIRLEERLELALERVAPAAYPGLVSFAAAVDRAQGKDLVFAPRQTAAR